MPSVECSCSKTSIPQSRATSSTGAPMGRPTLSCPFWLAFTLVPGAQLPMPSRGICLAGRRAQWSRIGGASGLRVRASAFRRLWPRTSRALLDLPERVAGAGNVLGQGPVAWLQVDTHLDNTLFSPDGTVVLLDWCNAAIGPPVVDVTRFLAEGVVPP